ncbi:MAG: 4Fe-4S dicluster domain-containing protein [Caldilineae bacterium]|nr:MAG: 4Fe-4S dicluster domain-containing protein [Caldilineae bacterium]
MTTPSHNNRIWITIDGRSLQVPPDITIREAAALAGVEIPTICYHDALTPNAVCRICVVEWRGARTLVPACVARVADNAIIQTNSRRVRTARRTLLEMLASAVDLSQAPEIQAMMQEYDADPDRFGPEARRRETGGVKDDNPFYVRDYDKCILCWRCVQVCAEDVQHTFALGFNHRGFDTEIATFFNLGMKETTCVFCGNCVGVCPTGALKGKRLYELELRGDS